MIDISQLRGEKINKVKELVAKKDPSFDVDRLAVLDQQVRELQQEVEVLRAQKNQLAQQAKSGVTQEIKEQSIALGKTLKQQEKQLDGIKLQFDELYACCPNIVDECVPAGGKEANQVVKTVGEKPEFDFMPQSHLDLGNRLGWFDFPGAAKMTGSNFALYKDQGVRLLYSLTNMLLKNNIKHGFTPMMPPYMINEKSLQVVGQLPKFKDGVYKIENEDLYMSPTSEANLTNLYRDTIVSAADLPVRMTSWTSCFRREAGTYGHAERGLIRMHEFEKVELVSMTRPEDSEQELHHMIACAEQILQDLGLHYRVSLLAGQDTSFQSYKTYDIEVWMPGQGAYYEVSSASNCIDFQARRGKMRYKPYEGAKPELLHTLNASSLALPRLMVAIMETYQQEDGSIILPDVIYQQGWFNL